MRFLAARRAAGPLCPSLKIQVSSLSPYASNACFSPTPTPFCCCFASDGTSHALSRALPVGRPFCSPSLMHRPIWGELRLKDPYCLSPRGSRALARKMTSPPNYPPRGKRQGWQSVQTQPIVASGLARTRASRPNRPLSRGWKCPKEGKQPEAEEPY